MPKLKTHKGAAKRFTITGTGKIMRAKGHKSHLRRNKAPRTRRLYDEMIPVAKADEKRLKELMPYGVVR
jgi:large subunit ribosomal protein L35